VASALLETWPRNALLMYHATFLPPPPHTHPFSHTQLNARQQATSASNPTGNAFVCEETDLTTVQQAQRLAAPELNRVWRIKNNSKRHPYRCFHLPPNACCVAGFEPERGGEISLTCCGGQQT
jgi:hypothetical protein